LDNESGGRIAGSSVQRNLASPDYIDVVPVAQPDALWTPEGLVHDEQVAVRGHRCGGSGINEPTMRQRLASSLLLHSKQPDALLVVRG
jgi:hypothetical protein